MGVNVREKILCSIDKDDRAVVEFAENVDLRRRLGEELRDRRVFENALEARAYLLLGIMAELQADKIALEKLPGGREQGDGRLIIGRHPLIGDVQEVKDRR